MHPATPTSAASQRRTYFLNEMVEQALCKTSQPEPPGTTASAASVALLQTAPQPFTGVAKRRNTAGPMEDGGGSRTAREKTPASLEDFLAYHKRNVDVGMRSFEELEEHLALLLDKHEDMNELEEEETKKRKLEDMDLNRIHEHFTSKKNILEKIFGSFLQMKRGHHKREAAFV